ncbi:hypothetical protein D3H55_10645 [Bacillus salacetis]|uniref:Uncharacterized protein n=1 Tax=Bacillus salacetis TaxID=2315464 RepID=A0A3A1R4M8_9BACI|nr:hypothetical protein [Bacillus salacetis]RIW34044.1 hypothetical protein D3H55_10645 [Bacillus salacetis]
MRRTQDWKDSGSGRNPGEVRRFGGDSDKMAGKAEKESESRGDSDKMARKKGKESESGGDSDKLARKGRKRVRIRG